jgi:hypothetical protein
MMSSGWRPDVVLRRRFWVIGKQTTAMFGSHSAGSGLTHHVDPAMSAWNGHGFSQTPFTDHGMAHVSGMLR